jgi:hypothetical protein
MKTKTALLSAACAILLAAAMAAAQDTAGAGFVITLKNGSSIRGRTLARDEASGKLRLIMTETDARAPKSYAMIAMEDADAIRASTTDTESIRIKVRGGSDLRCKEFGLAPDKVTVKIGTSSRIEIPWDQIESISFGPSDERNIVR